MKTPNILILHASVGAGHTRAAKAAAAALALEAPDANAVVVDALDLARPLFKKAYGDGYLKLVDRAPALFGWLFAATDKPPRGRALGDRLRRAVSRWGASDFTDLLERGDWDAVVSTHFLPPELIAALREGGRFKAPLLTVVTDYDAHRIWVHDPGARYCVAGLAAAASLRGHGVAADKISITGIPVDPAFSAPADRDAARRAFGLSGGYPVVVQSAGGHGVGPLEDGFRALLASTVPSEIVVVCGRNQAAKEALGRLRPPSRHRVRIVGFTDKMRELMSVADLLVTKPGGLTVSEALACGLPMVLINPIPGQEERNADYLLENGAAVKANSSASLTAKVEDLLSSPARMSEMRRRAKRLGRPRAAFAVARAALELARGRSEAAEISGPVSAAAFMTSHWVVPGLVRGAAA